MSIQDIKRICGTAPEDYTQVIPTDSNYIFYNDPSYSALNLYDFFGGAATVNSYEECAYYVSLGFDTSEFNIFDIGTYAIAALGIFLATVFLLKKFKFNKISLKSGVSHKYLQTRTLLKKKKVKFAILGIYTLIQNYFIFDFVKTKALRIPKFIDEYIALTSNVNFFQSLDFNAGSFIGGSYSIYLTSGPISSLGSVVGWFVTNNIYISRISNYYWLVFLELIFIYLLIRFYKMSASSLILFSSLFILLIPWWQGGLYSLGEIASMIIFINSLFLFSKFRKTSLILFSFSIFFGKILTLLPFSFFYLAILSSEKSVKKAVTDFLYFIIPLITWLILIFFNFENGTVFEYIQQQISLVLNHQSSGVAQDTSINIVESISTSEVSNWNFYDKLRLGYSPVVFIILLLKNKSKINNYFGNLVYPLISAFSITYIWFWILSPTKWMRYSQHFSIIMIITLLYILSSNITKDKIDYLLITALLGIFIENQKFLILMLLGIVVLFLLFKKDTSNTIIINYIIIIFIFIDISIPYFEKDFISEIQNPLPECLISISSEVCRDAYIEG